MKITKKQLKQIIKEELNPYLTGQGAEVERSAAKANRYEDWFQRALDGDPDPEKNQTKNSQKFLMKKHLQRRERGRRKRRCCIN